MAKEEKELLLKDLSARLPYGVKVERNGDVCEVLGIIDDNIFLTANVPTNQQTKVVNIKPYLRPISSMTKEEAREYNPLYAENENGNEYDDLLQYSELLDWLNAHHFDYRLLIEDNLALEAPEGMYIFENEKSNV